MPGQQAAVIPFTSAAIEYREKIFSTTWQPGASAIDLSPPGGVIKSYGYLRALRLHVTTSVAGTGGTLAADAPWNLFSQIAVTQPNGEEMFGGPTFSGYHAYQAAKHSGWRLANDPLTWPSFSSGPTSIVFDLPIVFELNSQLGVGSLPNQDFSAPWKLQLTANTSAGVYSVAPTTAPTFKVDVYMDCWTVPSPVSPLNRNIGQEITPPLLGTLNKWTVQQYSVTANSPNNILLQRKGNSIRNLVFVLRGAANARQAVSNYPNPLSIRWDGTNVRATDVTTLIVDDEYATRGGQAAATPVSADVGVIALQLADIAGVDAQGVAAGFGMGQQWGTVQSSTLEMDGTFGANGTLLEVLTNDVQFVDLAGNPYAFGAGGYLQAPAQPGTRP